MSEEEKKAIEILKDNLKEYEILSETSYCSSDRELYRENTDAIEKILNLIEKQQKEIEELEEKIEKDFKTFCKYEDTLEHYEYEVFKDNTIDLSKLKELDEIGIEGKKYISKDKINDKIMELVELLKEE